jgi:TldD protein
MRRGKHIDIDSLESIASEGVDYALSRKTKYADVRIQHEEGAGFVISGGEAEEGSTVSLTGIGVRAIVNGAWGFCSADNAFSKPKIRETVDRAIKLASKSSQGATSPVQMAPTKTIRTRIRGPNGNFTPSEELTLENMLEPAKAFESRIGSLRNEIQTSSLSFTVGRFIETFANSDGSLITQTYSGFLGTVFIVASSSGVIQYYPYDFGGLGRYEEFLDEVLPALTEKIARKACQLTKSRAMQETATSQRVVMDPHFAALWVHETLGHPLEADRLLGGRGDPQNAPWTYKTFGSKVAPELFSLVDDPSAETPAWHRYDDEGVEAKKKTLITNGVMKDCIHNRETAAAFRVEPNGGARSPSYHFTPMPRMSNTYIEPGDWTFDEIIEDTKHGIYVAGGMTPLVDTRAYEWRISAKEAYIVEKGEIKEMLRDVILLGDTPDFLVSVDAIGKDLQIAVTPDCGKGSPIQMLPVGNGGPTIRGRAQARGAEQRLGSM